MDVTAVRENHSNTGINARHSHDGRKNAKNPQRLLNVKKDVLSDNVLNSLKIARKKSAL